MLPGAASSCNLLATRHPGGNSGANLKSISHRCYLWEVAFERDLTKETTHLLLGCLQGGLGRTSEGGAEPLAASHQLERPGGNPGANPKSLPHRCYLREVAFEWELTK